MQPFKKPAYLIFIHVPFFWYSAMAIFPFVIIKEEKMKGDALLLNHELIHHQQQLELAIVPFYLIYGIHYLINFIRFRNHDRAYREIIFEREAYQMDKDLNYLQRRKIFAFTKF